MVIVPFSVNLLALLIRLSSACRKRVWSAWIVPRSAGQSMIRRLPFFVAIGSMVLATSWITGTHPALAAWAQQPSGPRKLGVMMPEARPVVHPVRCFVELDIDWFMPPAALRKSLGAGDSWTQPLGL